MLPQRVLVVDGVGGGLGLRVHIRCVEVVDLQHIALLATRKVIAIVLLRVIRAYAGAKRQVVDRAQFCVDIPEQFVELADVGFP